MHNHFRMSWRVDCRLHAEVYEIAMNRCWLIRVCSSVVSCSVEGGARLRTHQSFPNLPASDAESIEMRCVASTFRQIPAAAKNVLEYRTDAKL
jgi:hypothetical protein